MQGWTLFLQDAKPSRFSGREIGMGQSRCQLRTLKSHNPEKALGPKPPKYISPPIISSNWPIQRELIYACHQGISDLQQLENEALRVE